MCVYIYIYICIYVLYNVEEGELRVARRRAIREPASRKRRGRPYTKILRVSYTSSNTKNFFDLPQF